MRRGGFPYHELGDGEVVTAVCHKRLALPQPPHCPTNLLVTHLFMENNIIIILMVSVTLWLHGMLDYVRL